MNKWPRLRLTGGCWSCPVRRCRGRTRPLSCAWTSSASAWTTAAAVPSFLSGARPRRRRAAWRRPAGWEARDSWVTTPARRWGWWRLHLAGSPTASAPCSPCRATSTWTETWLWECRTYSWYFEKKEEQKGGDHEESCCCCCCCCGRGTGGAVHTHRALRQVRKVQLCKVRHQQLPHFRLWPFKIKPPMKLQYNDYPEVAVSEI